MTTMTAQWRSLLLGVALAAASLGAAATQTITYYHNDLAGSPVVATDEDGYVIWRESYRPYGERLVNSPAASGNRVWFTSRRQDAETGLVYMGARYYDPVAGRFVSVDPVGFDEGNIHSFNRYAYANNNPYRYVDPDGRSPFTIFAIEAAKHTGAGYVMGVAADAISQGAAFGSVDWGMAATSSAAIAGGEAGLLAGAFTGGSAAKSAAQAARVGAQAADRTVIQVGERQLHLSTHALERAAQRGISQEQIQSVVRKADPFSYVHEGVTKTGYYDPASRIFVGEAEGTIATTFKTGARYIENLMKTAP